MLFPDQSPIVLLALLVALLAMALIAAARDLLGQRGGGDMACPHCGQAFDPNRWARRNERAHYHGRYTISPLYTCPRCGETVQPNQT